eukprot:1798727-Prymnesium_polylepis.1
MGAGPTSRPPASAPTRFAEPKASPSRRGSAPSDTLRSRIGASRSRWPPLRAATGSSPSRGSSERQGGMTGVQRLPFAGGLDASADVSGCKC